MLGIVAGPTLRDPKTGFDDKCVKITPGGGPGFHTYRHYWGCGCDIHHQHIKDGAEKQARHIIMQHGIQTGMKYRMLQEREASPLFDTNFLKLN